MTTSPALPKQGTFLRRPAGAGTLTFHVRAINATKVRFHVTPTGTEMFNENQLIGQDTNGHDGWTLAWRNPDQTLLANLTVKAIASGGTSADTELGLYNPDPPG